MDCLKIQELLPVYHDRDLDQALVQSIGEHLKMCDQCRKGYSDLVTAWDVMDVWEDAVPSDRLKKRVLGSVPAGRGRRKWLHVALPVAAGLIIMLGFVLYHAGTETGKKPGDLAGGPILQKSAEHTGINEDEVIANLELLKDEEFFDAMEEMVKIDYLPLVDEPSGSEKDRERSSLDVVLT